MMSSYGATLPGRAATASAPAQRVWGAISRALRTPSINDDGIGINFAVSGRLSLAISGQHLFDRAHAEYATGPGLTATGIPRSAVARLTWTF
jgi:hypothetical protein